VSMAEVRKFGSTKAERKNASANREQHAVKLIPFIPITLDEMPQFKELLYKAITTEEVFMVYNGRKFSKEYAKFVIKVVEQEGK